VSEDLKRVEFETTPIMSTYYVPAELIRVDSSFSHMHLENMNTSKHSPRLRYHGKRIPVRVYTTKGLIKQR
jgi:hypothetical protein